ncbi:Translation initiation factor IF-2 [Penicillium hispanicum]|uniref:Translation initiation factor IF-2 n=1 Tax=Penicillium hispanicum TaxID=1080232 RepID=UPI002540820A|nr:Translation initiation factor IF-2 [Penicillium hispanicum]KAJ5585134.1 Translation initiation factor IF-2 [Penicillium hispanicum]
MHRRALYRFSRRVDLSSTSVASAQNLPSSRTFRSSAIRRDDNGDPPVPKFGNRWGNRQASKPIGLSPAEQALRASLVAKSKPEPEPTSSTRSETRQNQRDSAYSTGKQDYLRAWNDRDQRTPRPNSTSRREPGRQRERRSHPHSRSKRDWICAECDVKVFAKHKACPYCQAPAPASVTNRHRPEQTAADWDCPTCDTKNSERRYSCQNCGTRRREVRSPRTDQELSPFQKLGRSMLHESEGASDDERRDMEDSAKVDRESRGWLRGQASASKEAAKDTDAASEQPRKDQWSWDMSALEQLESVEAQQDASDLSKKPKRRDGRKQRQGDAEESDFDVDERERRREDRKRMKKAKSAKKDTISTPAPLYLPEFISVSNLADVLGVRPNQFVQRMEDMGFEDVSYSHVLDAETAGLVAAEFNYEAIFDTGADDLQAAPVPEDTSALPTRPPVVTIMGHVDHGKTTILDWLRKSSVVATEHGGITQHIGAFSVAMPSGKTITFLDTPGHSAFLEMRRRGADVTDIVVLVVAADDSVKPQTIEAIKHATQANVPIIVAISKIDKEGRNPDRVKQDLSVHGVHVEDYGGDVQAIGVSGKTGEGMLELEEAIGALSEMLDHRADTTGNAEGWVIEASTKSYGRVASALVRRGTLRPGDVIVAGTTWARVRTLRNEAGVAISEATPGMPVEIDGWREQPAAGTEILQAPTEQRAKEVVEYRLGRTETEKMGQDMAAINEARRELLEKRKLEDQDVDEAARASTEPSGPKPVHFIVKADVDGSAEAVLNSISAIGNNEVYANILRSGVGPVTEFDIEHAASANGLVISFNMPIDPAMVHMAEQERVKIMDHNIIYKLMDDVKEVLSEQLPPTITKRVTGEAQIQQVFEITVKGREKTAIAGCRVRNGLINRTRKVRVIRGDETIYDGSIVSLKNVKKDVTEMRKDTECGINFEDWTGFVVGDHVQCYEEIHEKRFL